MEACVEERRDRRAVGLDHDDTAAGCERPNGLVEEGRWVGEVVEHIEHHDVRDRAVRVRKRERSTSLSTIRSPANSRSCPIPEPSSSERPDAGESRAIIVRYQSV